jgi:ACS family glucarate transporter-like MFS transporter
MVVFGWQWAFFCSALIGLIMLVIWLLNVRDRPEDHPRVNASELDYIRQGLTVGTKPLAISWIKIIRNRQVALLTFSYFCYGYTAYIFFTWFFKYLSTVRGLNLASSAFYGMLPFIAMAICSPLGGWVSDLLAASFGKRRGRCWTACVVLVVAAGFVALATRATDARVASVLLAGGAGALYLSQSAYWTLSADIGGSWAGSVSGVMNMGTQIGGVVTASLTAILADHFGWNVSFMVAGAICFVGALTWLFIDPDQELET